MWKDERVIEMKCKHEGEVRWMYTGRLCKIDSYGARPLSKKQVPVLYCKKCDKDFIVKFEEVKK